MYGLTECMRASYLPPDQLDARPTSSGIAIPGTEAWIEDADGKPAGAGRGRRADGPRPARHAGLLARSRSGPRSGCGRVAGRGSRCSRRATCSAATRRASCYFVGRTDDLIKSGGEKVYPREIEDVLHAAAGVQEAAVVGVPDRLLGQAVHAHVAPVDGHDSTTRRFAGSAPSSSRTTRSRSASSSTRPWPGPRGARSTARR